MKKYTRLNFLNRQHCSLAALFVFVIFLPTLALGQQLAEKNIQLSLNENAFGPAKGVKEAIIKELDNINRYPAHDGEKLVQAIAAHEGVDSDQVVLGELLDLLGVYLGLRGGPGSEFIYTVPGYPALVNGAAKVGGKVISVPLNERLENDLPTIAAKVNDKTQAVYLVNPHNPSGTVTDTDTFHQFLKDVSKKTLIIVDEAYLEFADDFAGRTAVKNIKQGDNVVVFRTFAKAYGLAGLSIGYAIAPKPLAAYLKEQGLGDLHELNRVSTVAALASLKDSTYLDQVHNVVVEERDKWNSFLDKLTLKHTTSQANFVYFDAGKPYELVAEHLRRHGIVIGRAFAPYNTWVRITIGLPEENAKAQNAILSLLK